MKRILSFLLCLIFCINIAFTVNATEQTEEAQTVDILVWAKDITQGTRITKSDVKTITVSNKNIPENVLSDAEAVYKTYAKRDLYAGEYVSKDQFSEDSVRKANKDVLIKPIVTTSADYIIVTDFLIANTGEDLSYFLQQLIDKNPNRTIYFPDGVYTISRSLLTSAVAKESVSIQLSDGAVIKASKKWSTASGKALIVLGEMPRNDIKSVGHYYIVSGGTLDGSGVANGIHIKSGRETVVKNICIKDTIKGIEIDEGANSKSADCDFEDITIIGNGRPGTIGIENRAYDNTYTNIRIYDMATGFHNTMGGEVANIYVTFTEKSKDLKQSRIGIYNKGGRMSHCLTVNGDQAYKLEGDVIIFECTATWTSADYKKQNAFSSNKRIVFSGCKAYFCPGDGVTTKFYEGTSIIEGCFVE